MTIQDILKLPRNSIAPYGRQLAEAYWELFNLRVCLSCYGDVTTMIYKLKKYYNMITNFQLKKDAYYRLEKGKAGTISNDTMTDELAIAFLKVRPERIELFSKYPDNWEELISDEPKEIEIPSEGIKGSIGDKGMDLKEYTEFKEAKEEDCGCKDKSNSNPKETTYDCRECLFKDLQPLKVKEIQELFPDVKYKGGTKKETYMEQIADHLNLQ